MVGAHAQPMVLGKQASSIAAMLPPIVLPNLLPAMMVILSKTLSPAVEHFGQVGASGVAEYSTWQDKQ